MCPAPPARARISGFVDEFALSPGWFWFTTVYFCTDLVLNFFTAYFKDKQLVTQLHRSVSATGVRSCGLLDLMGRCGTWF